MNDTLVIIFILLITFLLGVAEYRRKECIKRDDRIAELEELCFEKDAKIDVLIKALGRSQITINEPRRRK